MQAALMYGPNDIRVEEIEKPKCPEGGFVLKVMAVGLCGSEKSSEAPLLLLVSVHQSIPLG